MRGARGSSGGVPHTAVLSSGIRTVGVHVGGWSCRHYCGRRRRCVGLAAAAECPTSQPPSSLSSGVRVQVGTAQVGGPVTIAVVVVADGMHGMVPEGGGPLSQSRRVGHAQVGWPRQSAPPSQSLSSSSLDVQGRGQRGWQLSSLSSWAHRGGARACLHPCCPSQGHAWLQAASVEPRRASPGWGLSSDASKAEVNYGKLP
jgi:hypothetical protein